MGFVRSQSTNASARPLLLVHFEFWKGRASDELAATASMRVIFRRLQIVV
jgi:hypothetical protein